MVATSLCVEHDSASDKSCLCLKISRSELYSLFTVLQKVFTLMVHTELCGESWTCSSLRIHFDEATHMSLPGTYGTPTVTKYTTRTSTLHHAILHVAYRVMYAFNVLCYALHVTRCMYIYLYVHVCRVICYAQSATRNLLRARMARQTWQKSEGVTTCFTL